MSNIFTQKLKNLPKGSGTYLFRDERGRIIYVGKAVNLKNRVSSYFNNQEKDPKTEELVGHIKKFETIETGSEFEALILESELVKRYKPKYNIRLKDDKNYAYIKVGSENYPRITITRKMDDDSAKYLGPFMDASALRQILKYARKIFPFCTCSLPNGKVCLYFHLGLCRGHDEKYISSGEYKKDINGLIKLFSGKTDYLANNFKEEMLKAAKEKRYEDAANFRDKLNFLDRIKESHFISERDLSADKALFELKKELNLSDIPSRIECYDISNIMGTAAVGSMVVFKNGIASPKDYRRFKIRTVKGSNDFAMMAEVLARRFRSIVANKVQQLDRQSLKINNQNSNLNRSSKFETQKLNLPDLVILDGGKGQLSAVLQNVIIPEGTRVIALAKKQETIYSLISEKETIRQSILSSQSQLGSLNSLASSRNSKLKINSSKLIRNSKFEIRNLKKDSESFFLVQRIRDEAHRFAVTYHRNLKSKEIYESSLDAIPGVGPKTKKKLIREFGSIQKIKEASPEELAFVVGEKLAQKIKNYSV